MGVLTDLVIGTAAELRALGRDEIPAGVLPSLDIKGLGLVEIGVLHAAIAGSDFDGSLDQFSIVSGQDSEEGPWVFQLSDNLIERLGGLTDAEVARTAAALIQDEHFSDWQESELGAMLSSIRAFALEARRVGKPVHVWTSL